MQYMSQWEWIKKFGIRQWFRDSWGMASIAVGQEWWCERGVKWKTMTRGQHIQLWFETLVYMIAQWTAEAECLLNDHEIVDCSTAGPDSGNMDHCCTRCGKYWSCPLY